MSNISMAYLREVGREAGNYFRDKRPKEQIAKEGVFNFVTNCDIEVQALLTERLLKAAPEAVVIGEESPDRPHVPAKGEAFILDPIDGTSNFIAGMACSVVCIAYCLDGKQEMSVVYNPYANELYSAKRGEGAWLNERRLHVPEFQLRDSLLAADLGGYRADLRERSLCVLRQLFGHALGIRIYGSAAFALCQVAAGRLSAYISMNLQIWDYAAAELILSEAGAVVSTQTGEPLGLRQSTPLAAASRTAHAELMRLLREARAEA